MKKLLVIQMILLAFSLSDIKAFGFIIKEGNESFVLDLKDWTPERAYLSVTDAKGLVLLGEHIHPKKKGRKYSISNFEKGIYFITIEDSTRKLIQEIIVDVKGLHIKNTFENIYLPQISRKRNKILLNYLTMGKDAKLTFVHDASDESIFKYTFSGELTIAKVFDISNLHSGRYTVVVKCGGHSFKYNFLK